MLIDREMSHVVGVMTLKTIHASFYSPTIVTVGGAEHTHRLTS